MRQALQGIHKGYPTKGQTATLPGYPKVYPIDRCSQGLRCYYDNIMLYGSSDIPFYMDNCGNSRANTCIKTSTPVLASGRATCHPGLCGRGVFIRPRPMFLIHPGHSLNTASWFTLTGVGLDVRPGSGDLSITFGYYDFWYGYAPTMVVTGNGESGFDSGEGA
ncbi:hypothetical protein SLEP1_g60560 [Rubroshorea leprosula]|uniref:Uncharacterized protein n=1 Tax=Rubroshorea leprosula TaxID=152421 RepID=A0AAV5MX39_9ROSI|nr:hypothetical protein SLEP1_g60560 [Rubroshorea leprosula]